LRLVYDHELNIPKNIDPARRYYEKLNRVNRKIIDRMNVSRADKIVVPSKYIAELFSSVYKKSAEVVYLGVDTAFFSPAQEKRNIDILYVGSTDQLNGYRLFEDAIKNIKNTIKIRKILYEKEWLNDLEMRDVYRRTKILVATSFNEPLGLIPLEAAACEDVVIALDEAGYKETVINGKTGYLLPRDPKKIAKKIESLITHQNTLKEIGNNGRTTMVKNWSWEKRTNEFEKIIKNHIGN
jgi:glycosyltransferase involved in cell wall biosynthesis